MTRYRYTVTTYYSGEFEDDGDPFNNEQELRSYAAEVATNGFPDLVEVEVGEVAAD